MSPASHGEILALTPFLMEKACQSHLQPKTRTHRVHSEPTVDLSQAGRGDPGRGRRHLWHLCACGRAGLGWVAWNQLWPLGVTHRSACCSSPWGLVSGLPQRWGPQCPGSDGLLLGLPVFLGQFSRFSTTSAIFHSVCLALFRYISYPRTETNIFPKDLDLAALVELQTPDPRWGAFARNILERGGPTPRNGNKSDQAHPPIHPTKYTDSLQVGIPGCAAEDPQGSQGSGLG